VGVVNLAQATLVFLFQGRRGLTWEVFWMPYIGGLVWTNSGIMAVTAMDRLGMARAYGILAPLIVVVSILWGAVIFEEFIPIKPVWKFPYATDGPDQSRVRVNSLAAWHRRQWTDRRLCTHGPAARSAHRCLDLDWLYLVRIGWYSLGKPQVELKIEALSSRNK
jgi:hypothetical protein